LARFKIAKGGFTLTFVGFDNYKKLFFGTEQTHFLGAFAPLTPAMWFVFGIIVIGLAMFLARYVWNTRVSIGGLIGRLLLVLGLGTLAWIFTRSLWSGGRLGTLTITIVYVFVGIFFQYIIGLGLAMLTVQNIPGRRFFRVVFLLPMMITPVGVAYMFRMLTDTSKPTSGNGHLLCLSCCLLPSRVSPRNRWRLRLSTVPISGRFFSILSGRGFCLSV
jgi:multiple sugar transport system permease protein